jgi:hypothetical protein
MLLSVCGQEGFQSLYFVFVNWVIGALKGPNALNVMHISYHQTFLSHDNSALKTTCTPPSTSPRETSLSDKAKLDRSESTCVVSTYYKLERARVKACIEEERDRNWCVRRQLDRRRRG